MNGSNNTKPKLELQINIPKKIKFLQNQPAVGENQYGKWFLYNVLSDNKEQSFFAPEQVVEFISKNQLKKNSEIEITKKLVKNGNKNTADFLIELVSNGKPQDTSISLINSEGQGSKGYEIMLDAVKQAMKIREELGVDIDINKIGITLFIQKCKKY